MALYTSTYLTQLSEQTSTTAKERLFTESRKTYTTFDIFLSHSFLDKKEVEGIYIELTNMGFSVYVDWIVDPHLDRNNVTKATAELIRNRMKSSKSLLLAISTNAVMSKWMPWELGFVDGQKSRCAIFPVSKEAPIQKTFKRVEYLLLYPYIKKAEINYRQSMFVVDSSNSYVLLNEWTNSGLNPTYNSKNIDEL